MKSIVALSNLALVSLSSIAPCLAVNQAVSRSSDQALPSQALPSAAKTTQVAGLLDSVINVVNTVDREKKRAQQQADRERQEQERLEQQENAARERQQRAEAYQKQQQERAAAAAAAREQEQKRFDSMTPAQQKAYLAQKRAQQQAEWDFLGQVFRAGMGSGGSAAPQQSDADIWRTQQQINERQRLPEPQPAPAPVQPIDPFYGDRH